MSTVRALRLVLADDAVLVREGLARLLAERGFDVVAQTADADALVGAVTDLRPDIAVIDVRMPPTHTTEGLVAAGAIRRDFPDVAILVLSQQIETRHLAGLLHVGARAVGYLLKERVLDIGSFAATIRQVAQGGVVIDPLVVGRMVGRSRRSDPLAALTVREREVLGLMAEGRSNHAISQHLFLNARTVESHVRNIFLKLDLELSGDEHRRVLAVLTYLGAPTDAAA